MIQELDFYFPFIVFIYGLTMTVVTSFPLAQVQRPEYISDELLHWVCGHRLLGIVCLFVGGLWSIQRLLI